MSPELQLPETSTIKGSGFMKNYRSTIHAATEEGEQTQYTGVGTVGTGESLRLTKQMRNSRLFKPSVLASSGFVAGWISEPDRSIFTGESKQDKPDIKGVPSLDWRSLHDPILTDLVRRLLQRVWAIIISKALHTRFPLEATSVSIFKDPTTSERKAVLRVQCNANAVQAIAFWKSLE